MKVVAVLNYKGGVGKTTFTACMAQALALAGKRVLAIDNDCQHNLSFMLGQAPRKPTIRDIYLSSIGPGARLLRESLRDTDVSGLQLITAPSELCNDDIKDPMLLRKCITYCKLQEEYDYILIDNSPGLDRVQQAALHAADTLFVPTELSHFAISGLYEMHRTLHLRFRNECQITRVVPMFYRGTRSHDNFLEILRKLFPARVAQTTIPYDTVFQGLTEEHKVLFVHRLASRAARRYLILLRELFGLEQAKIWQAVSRARDERLRAEATQRLRLAREEKKRLREENRPDEGFSVA
jgi:chromosome partitioning protein